MAIGTYLGAGGVKDLKECYVGAGGVKTVKEIYVGVGGVPKLVWSNGIGDFEVLWYETVVSGNVSSSVYHISRTKDFKSFELLENTPISPYNGIFYDNDYTYFVDVSRYKDEYNNRRFSIDIYRRKFGESGTSQIYKQDNDYLFYYSGDNISSFSTDILYNYDEKSFHWSGMENSKTSGSTISRFVIQVGVTGIDGSRKATKRQKYIGQSGTGAGFGQGYIDLTLNDVYYSWYVSGSGTITSKYIQEFGASTQRSYSTYWDMLDIILFNDKLIWAAGDGYLYICSDTSTFDHGTRITLPNSIGTSVIDVKFLRWGNTLIVIVRNDDGVYFVKSTNGTSYTLSCSISGSTGVEYVGNNGSKYYFYGSDSIYTTSDFSTIETTTIARPDNMRINSICCKN